MTSAEEKNDAFVWRADVQTEALCAHMSAIFILELSLSADLYFDPLRLFIHKYSVGCWLLLSFVLTWSLLCGWLDKHTCAYTSNTHHKLFESVFTNTPLSQSVKQISTVSYIIELWIVHLWREYVKLEVSRSPWDPDWLEMCFCHVLTLQQ